MTRADPPRPAKNDQLACSLVFAQKKLFPLNCRHHHQVTHCGFTQIGQWCPVCRSSCPSPGSAAPGQNLQALLQIYSCTLLYAKYTPAHPNILLNTTVPQIYSCTPLYSKYTCTKICSKYTLYNFLLQICFA